MSRFLTERMFLFMADTCLTSKIPVEGSDVRCKVLTGAFTGVLSSRIYGRLREALKRVNEGVGKFGLDFFEWRFGSGEIFLSAADTYPTSKMPVKGSDVRCNTSTGALTGK